MKIGTHQRTKHEESGQCLLAAGRQLPVWDSVGDYHHELPLASAVKRLLASFQLMTFQMARR